MEKLGKIGVPGFRNGKKWKMAIAVFGYFLIFLILLAIATPLPPLRTVEEIKSSVIQASNSELLRSPDEYSGKIVMYEGRVNEVISNDEYIISNGSVSNMVFVVCPMKNKLLAGDTVKVWGEVAGTETYTTQMGYEIPIPKIKLLYLEFKKAEER